MVGAQLEEFDRMVDLQEHHEWAVIEGDEYLSSPVDLRPKFLWYGPHVTLVTGIAWDHVNVFPTEEDYIQQFRTYLQTVQPGGTVVHCTEDAKLEAVMTTFENAERTSDWVGYSTPRHTPTPREAARSPLKMVRPWKWRCWARTTCKTSRAPGHAAAPWAWTWPSSMPTWSISPVRHVVWK